MAQLFHDQRANDIRVVRVYHIISHETAQIVGPTLGPCRRGLQRWLRLALRGPSAARREVLRLVRSFGYSRSSSAFTMSRKRG